MSRRRLKPYFKIFEDLGVQVLEVGTTGSCHHRIIVEASGHRRFFVIPFSSSDSRALLNFKSDVRKWQREVTQQGNQ